MMISFARHQFPPAIIRHAVWLYLRFTLSYRDVEDLLAERGLDVSYETVRRCLHADSPPQGVTFPRRITPAAFQAEGDRQLKVSAYVSIAAGASARHSHQAAAFSASSWHSAKELERGPAQMVCYAPSMEAELKLDEAILEELERGGAGNSKQIGKRLSIRVYEALQRLVRDEKVVKSGWPGRGNEKMYGLPETTFVL
jgi:hypothetical protein